MVDFHALMHIKHVVETDFDTNIDREVQSKATCHPAWMAVMAKILRMPVPTYVEPVPVSGEIDVRRPAKPGTGEGSNMWNQNNGNGQGNGYGQQQGYGQAPPQNQGYGGGGDVYDRMNNSRDVGGARFPYIMDGTHKLALVTLEEFGDAANPKARALVKYLASSNPRVQVGSLAVKIWGLVKPPRFQNGTTEADEFVDFCRKLKGAPQSYPIVNDIRTLMKIRPQDQLARGTIIECNGVQGKVNPNNPGKDPYVRVYWNAIQQSPEQIAAMRARLEQEGIPNTGGQVMQQNQPMGQRLEQAGFQNQGQYTVQNNMQGTMQQAPMQGQQPAGPQQNYLQQTAQQPPQGGFLANVPPQGNGPQGGNGGQQGGW